MNSKEIIYISRSTDMDLYKQLGLTCNIAATKFNNLIMQGLSDKYKINSFYIYSKNIKKEQKIYKNNVVHYFCPNYNKIKRIIFLIKNLKKIKNSCSREIVLICDALCIGDSVVAQLIAKIYKWRTIGIFTDLPEYLGTFVPQKKRTILQKIRLKIYYSSFNLYDNFVLLTKQMVDKIDKANMLNSIVIEGFGNTKAFENLEINKKKQIMYAGSLQKEYGIIELINAFISIHDKFDDYKLVIYGKGDAEAEIKALITKYDFIDFKGMANIDVILQEEVDSMLLVNPRPTHTNQEGNEYTKYSFPSKNMEYMSSGTPMIGYKLPGMPDEYEKYIYVIKDEGYIGIRNILTKVLMKSENEIIKKGKTAQLFIKNEKEYNIQVKKILKKFNLE